MQKNERYQAFRQERVTIDKIILEAEKKCGTSNLEDDAFFIEVAEGYLKAGIPLHEKDQERHDKLTGGN